MKSPVIIVGTGSLAQLALEILQRNDILVYGFIAEKNISKATEINDIPILGNIEEISYLQTIGKDSAIFVGIESTTLRQQYIKRLSNTENQSDFINLIHPFTHIAGTVHLGIGNLVDVGSCISPGARLGNHCLVHKQIVIESGAIIHNFVQIGSGSIIGEQTTIGDNVFIGAGATIIGGIQIGKGARIGAGSVVLESIPENEVVLGNPAKSVKLNQ